MTTADARAAGCKEQVSDVGLGLRAALPLPHLLRRDSQHAELVIPGRLIGGPKTNRGFGFSDHTGHIIRWLWLRERLPAEARPPLGELRVQDLAQIYVIMNAATLWSVKTSG